VEKRDAEKWRLEMSATSEGIWSPILRPYPVKGKKFGVDFSVRTKVFHTHSLHKTLQSQFFSFMKFQYFSSVSTKISHFFRKGSDRGREDQTTYPTLDSSSNYFQFEKNPKLRQYFNHDF